MKVVVGTKTLRVDQDEIQNNEMTVDLPDGAVVTNLTFVLPFVVVQYWRPLR